MAVFNWMTSATKSHSYGAAYRMMPLSTAASTSWDTDTTPIVFLRQLTRFSHYSMFSFIVAVGVQLQS